MHSSTSVLQNSRQWLKVMQYMLWFPHLGRGSAAYRAILGAVGDISPDLSDFTF